MIEWQRVIHDTVKKSVVSIAKSLKEQNANAGISYNYNVHFPQSFKPGERTSIPVTLPSSAYGPLHVANVFVDVDMNGHIADIAFKHMDTAGPYDPSVQPDAPKTLTNTMDVLSNFFNDVNNILYSGAMASLLSPKLGNVMTSGIGMPGGNVMQIVGTGGTFGATNVPVARIGGSPVAWNKVRGGVLAAEQARAGTITSAEGQAEFLEQALGSISKSPHWYYALGGQQKEKMKEKIKVAYLGECKKQKVTVPPTLFFQKLSEGMLQRGQIVPYCDRSHTNVEGTMSGQCAQRSCPVYDPNCSKLSTRINTNSI